MIAFSLQQREYNSFWVSLNRSTLSSLALLLIAINESKKCDPEAVRWRILQDRPANACMFNWVTVTGLKVAT